MFQTTNQYIMCVIPSHQSYANPTIHRHATWLLMCGKNRHHESRVGPAAAWYKMHLESFM